MYVWQQKELSFGEKSLLQNIEELIVQELQLVTKRERELIVQNLQTPFKQLFFQTTTTTTQNQQVSSPVA